MPVIAVINRKGGSGKSTLATHLAAWLAHEGLSVLLGDIDRQQCTRAWLKRRDAHLPAIVPWAMDKGSILKKPSGITHVVLDTPGGLHGSRFKEVVKLADKVLVPLQPSIFDMFATRDFLDELAASRHAQSLQIGIVGMRVDARTIAADKLQEFVQTLGLPVLGNLRDTQNYVHLAARGLTIFDVAPARGARDLEQWQPLCEWLDR